MEVSRNSVRKVNLTKGKIMEMRHSPDNKTFKKLDTNEIRKSFLMENLFRGGTVKTVYLDLDRAIVGGAAPLNEPLPLLTSRKELASDFFAQRREIGVFNVGGTGKINADSKEFVVGLKDAVYVGRGTKEVTFTSVDAANPAYFYFVSFPAHSFHPTTFIKAADTQSARLGSREAVNMRTVRRYIHENGAKSSQLVMGLTELDEGSVWNTMPAHTHQRRIEIYFYFGLDDDSMVCHIMGEPDETRHLLVRDKQAVLSPSWSIHTGVGTRNYSFIWAMGGENQDYEDMDAVSMKELQ